MTSADGVTWTTSTPASVDLWNGVTYGDGMFVAVASTGSGHRVMTSTDGISWASQTTAADNNWYAITHTDIGFVAVAISGTGNRVMTAVAAVPVLEATPSPVSFGERPSGTHSSATEVTVTNSGTADLVFPDSAVALSGQTPTSSPSPLTPAAARP